jgi:hypothetical protein
MAGHPSRAGHLRKGAQPAEASLLAALSNVPEFCCAARARTSEAYPSALP